MVLFVVLRRRGPTRATRLRGFALAVIAVIAVIAVVAVGCGSDVPDTPAAAAVSVPRTPVATAVAVPGTPVVSTVAVPVTAAAPVPPATPNELGLRAVLDQFREDEVLHLVQVRINNTSQAKVRVTSVQLDWPGMTVVEPTPRSDLVAPGQVLDVPISFGVAVCGETPPGVDETPPDAPAVALATVRPGDDGPEVTTRIPIADQLHILARIYPSSCREQRVAGAATIRFGSTWTAVTENGQPGLAGTVVVDRNHGSDSVAITSMSGSVLLSVHPARQSQSALLTLEPGAQRGELAVVVVQSGNCLPHALAESKKTFILPVDVSLDGEPPLVYELSVDRSEHGRFGTMINESCGVG